MQIKKFSLSKDMFNPDITHVFEYGEEVGIITASEINGEKWFEAKGKHFSKGVSLSKFDLALDCFNTNAPRKQKETPTDNQISLSL